MKLVSIILVLVAASSFQAKAQTLTDTLPHKKNVLLEEFTGVECNSCPYGHIEIDSLKKLHPNRVFAAGMHSFSTGHTTPYPGDQDLRRKFPDDLRTKISDLGGIPAGIVSRRTFNGKEARIFWPFKGFHEPIDSCVNVVLNENSPFNIGLKADYDSTNKTLSIKTEVYTTEAVTGNYKLHVYFIESNIIVDQLNGSTVIHDYNEKHVYRESLTPTWGASLITTSAKKGALFNSTFTTKNDSNYHMNNVEVIAFVTDNSSTTNEKGYVMQVTGVAVNGAGNPSAMHEFPSSEEIRISPNPSSGEVYLKLDKPSTNNEIRISNPNGSIVYRKQIANETTIHLTPELTPGIYFISLKNNPGVVRKLVIY